MSPSGYRLGLILVTGSAVAWSTAGFFTRLIPLDIWTILAWRGLFGALGLAVVIIALRRVDTLRGMLRMGWPGWLFAIVSAVGMVLFITSLRYTTVAHVAVIYATVPFIAAALGWLTMRERPTAGAVIASLAALAGVAVMVGLGVEGGLFGDLLALGMTVSMAVMMIVARRFRDIPVMPAACLSAVISGLACWPLGEPLAVSSYDLLLLALFGIVNSALGLGALHRGRAAAAGDRDRVDRLARRAAGALVGVAGIRRNAQREHAGRRVDRVRRRRRAYDDRRFEGRPDGARRAEGQRGSGARLRPRLATPASARRCR